MYSMLLVMIMFVNTSGVPLNNAKPRLDERLGGNETDIKSHPYQVWSLCCCSVLRQFEISEPKKKPPVLIMTS